MKIPVFVSAPSILTAEQQIIYDYLIRQLDDLNLEPRALGRSDYPTEAPLREVARLVKKCSGGLVLGFVQGKTKSMILKPDTPEEKAIKNFVVATPWNQIEGAILFSLKRPTLVFKENSVSGGIFDEGVTDIFVHKMPSSNAVTAPNPGVREVLLKWQGQVRTHYYESE